MKTQTTNQLPKPTESVESQLAEYAANEPKKIAERNYWRDRALAAEESLTSALDGAACAKCGATGTFDRKRGLWACCDDISAKQYLKSS